MFSLYFTEVLVQNILERCFTTDGSEDRLMCGVSWGAERGHRDAFSKTAEDGLSLKHLCELRTPRAGRFATLSVCQKLMVLNNVKAPTGCREKYLSLFGLPQTGRVKQNTTENYFPQFWRLNFLVHRQLSSLCVLTWWKTQGSTLESLFQGHQAHSWGQSPPKGPTS